MRTFWLSLLLVAIVVASFILGRYSNPRSVVSDTRIDTLIVRDTIRDSIPKPIIRYVARIDSIAVPTTITDTVTNYIRIPIERVEYRTPKYYAVVEGYKPSLHYIETYNETIYIDRVERIKVKAHWGLGIQTGVTYRLNSNKVVPYIGVGIQYNILTW